MSDPLSPPAAQPTGDYVGVKDVLEAVREGASTAFDPNVSVRPAAPPPDLMSIISEAVAVYAAAKAGGKDWWRSRGMWGAVGAIASGVAALAIPVLIPAAQQPHAFLAAGVASVFFGALAGKGRMSAVGPIK